MSRDCCFLRSSPLETRDNKTCHQLLICTNCRIALLWEVVYNLSISTSHSCTIPEQALHCTCLQPYEHPRIAFYKRGVCRNQYYTSNLRGEQVCRYQQTELVHNLSTYPLCTYISVPLYLLTTLQPARRCTNITIVQLWEWVHNLPTSHLRTWISVALHLVTALRPPGHRFLSENCMKESGLHW